jgi:hypothetical protein
VRPWREHEDPWLEAERLESAGICKNLGWTRRKLNTELNSVASPEAFIARLQRALADLDAPRLMHRDPAKPATKNPAMAAKGEPEMVPEWFEIELAADNNSKDYQRSVKTNEARKAKPLAARLDIAIKQAKTRGTPIGTQLGAIERQVERIERRLDRV